ncbi:MAG: hypothetical protein AB2L14_32565 [Candidatus Xenobiia bacterium LiM19]
MKNQYFGDINDFRKYGLLRILSGKDIRLGVCWMLTPDDGGSDGNLRHYLKKPEKWQRYDEDLFQCLYETVISRQCRDVHQAEKFLGSALFYDEMLEDRQEQRRVYFEQMLDSFSDLDLIFFDPDNGLEVASVPSGRKGCRKYIFWSELESVWKAGHSILIYQHFPRRKREEFIRDSAERYRTGLGSEVISFQTDHNVFFLLIQKKHAVIVKKRAEEAEKQWEQQFKIFIAAAPIV